MGQMVSGRAGWKRKSWAEDRKLGLAGTDAVVGDCDFLLDRAWDSGIVLFKMGVPGGSNLTLPGTAGRNRRPPFIAGVPGG